MSGRGTYAVGAGGAGGAYLGASEARELVGSWRDSFHQAWGGVKGVSDPAGFFHGGGRRHHHHHHNQQYRPGHPQPAYGQSQPGPYYRQPAVPYAQPAYPPRGYAQPAYAQPAYRAPQGGVTVRDHRLGAEAEAILAEATGEPTPKAWLREMDGPTMANRQVLPMNTGTTPVPISSTAQITSRPQRVAFRPERVFVSSADIGGSGSAANWIINDITIGNRSQFAQSGALPGDMFSNVAIDSFVTFETAQTAMDVVMIVTYQGSTEGGTPFYGSIIGTAAV